MKYEINKVTHVWGIRVVEILKHLPLVTNQLRITMVKITPNEGKNRSVFRRVLICIYVLVNRSHIGEVG